MALRVRRPPSVSVPAPPGLQVQSFHDSEDGYVVLSYPVPRFGAIAGLTPAEQEIVSGMLDGLSYADIADRRSCSVRTVANLVASSFRKLGVGSRIELAALVARQACAGEEFRS